MRTVIRIETAIAFGDKMNDDDINLKIQRTQIYLYILHIYITYNI